MSRLTGSEWEMALKEEFEEARRAAVESTGRGAHLGVGRHSKTSLASPSYTRIKDAVINEEIEQRDARVQRLCQKSSEIAAVTNKRMTRLKRENPKDWLLAARFVSGDTEKKLRGMVSYALTFLHQLGVRDTDLVVGCLARIEHSMGRSSSNMARLRNEATQHLRRLATKA